MALYLIVTLAGQRVALPAGPVDSVVEIDAISPVPHAPPRIAGLAALRSRVLTIIDSHESLGLDRSPQRAPMLTVIVALDGHQYGVLVDAVIDVVSIDEPPRPLSLTLAPGWARAASGLVEFAGEPLLLLDPEALIAGTEARAA